MNKKNFTRILVILVVASLGMANSILGQTKYSGVNGNEWIVDGQLYAKIIVAKEGIQRVSLSLLPATMKTALEQPENLAKLQLWYRGKQVALIGPQVVSEIVFYGVLNDGISDTLLYRPDINFKINTPTASARINTLVSLFSDNSAYFVTIGSSAGKRAVTVSQNDVSEPLASEANHLFVENQIFRSTSTHDPQDASVKPALINSFYEPGRGLTGPKLSSNSILQSKNTADDATRFKFNVRNAAPGSPKPKIKVLVAGRSVASRSITIHILNSSGAILRSNAAVIPVFSGFKSQFVEFDLEPTDIVSETGYLGFQGTASATSDLFSISYYSVSYRQNYNMNGLPSYKFLLNTASGNTSRLQISGLPATTPSIYDITDIYNVKKIDGDASNFKLPRIDQQTSNILLTTEVQDIQVESVTNPDLRNISKVPDYLIISTPGLFDSAKNYGLLRAKTSSAKGTKYVPYTISINDVYNHFNYGEPSPVAIRRFVDYMLSGTDKDKFLLLVGKSISYESDMVRELPDNVPTVGYPGSDELLVDGLAGVPINTPAIPFGRIPALVSSEVDIYKGKVEEYEFGLADGNFTWRNKIIHVNGGTDVSQAGNFAGYLASLASSYITAPKTVKPYLKSEPYSSENQTLTISELVGATAGVGIITFFGHGTTYRTDNNISYVSDPAKNYFESRKYAGMFYFGCDVNNIFRNRFNTTLPYGSRTRPVGMDWLFTPNKGAVTVFGNSWEGYESAFKPYMDDLYQRIFVPDDQKKPVGTLIKEIANFIVSSKSSSVFPYDLDLANIHQGMLLGDPAIKLLNSSPSTPLPVKLISFSGQAQNSEVQLNWSTAWEKDNSHFIIQRSTDAKKFFDIGIVEGKGTISEESKYVFIDSNPTSGLNYYRLVQQDLAESSNNDPVKTYSRIIGVSMLDKDLIILAPNPVISTFEIKGSVTSDIISWNIVDIKGNVIKKSGIGNNVDMSRYASGIYTLELITKNNVIKRKIVKQ